MLVLAPAACCLAAVAIHEVLKVLMHAVWQQDESPPSDSVEQPGTKAPPSTSKRSRPASAIKARTAIPGIFCTQSRLNLSPNP